MSTPEHSTNDDRPRTMSVPDATRSTNETSQRISTQARSRRRGQRLTVPNGSYQNSAPFSAQHKPDQATQKVACETTSALAKACTLRTLVLAESHVGDRRVSSGGTMLRSGYFYYRMEQLHCYHWKQM